MTKKIAFHFITRTWSLQADGCDFGGTFSQPSVITLPPTVLERIRVHYPYKTRPTSRIFIFMFPDPDLFMYDPTAEQESGDHVDLDPRVRAKHECIRRMYKAGDRTVVSLASLLWIGGFAYFHDLGSERIELVSLKAIVHKSTIELSFGQWASLPLSIEQELSDTGRFLPVSHPALSQAKEFTWVSPMEEIGGNVFQYGGFVYRFDDTGKVPACILPVSKLSAVHGDDKCAMFGESATAIAHEVRVGETLPLHNQNSEQLQEVSVIDVSAGGAITIQGQDGKTKVLSAEEVNSGTVTWPDEQKRERDCFRACHSEHDSNQSTTSACRGGFAVFETSVQNPDTVVAAQQEEHHDQSGCL